MVRQRNQAANPDTLMPKISATALRRPSDPILPSPWKSKVAKLVPSRVAMMLSATVRAWRRACWAVGGQNSPLGVGTSAQSPRAHSPGRPSTRSWPSTLIRPRVLGTSSASTSGWGDEGMVDTSVLVSMVVPSDSTARSPPARPGRGPPPRGRVAPRAATRGRGGVFVGGPAVRGGRGDPGDGAPRPGAPPGGGGGGRGGGGGNPGPPPPPPRRQVDGLH